MRPLKKRSKHVHSFHSARTALEVLSRCVPATACTENVKSRSVISTVFSSFKTIFLKHSYHRFFTARHRNNTRMRSDKFSQISTTVIHSWIFDSGVKSARPLWPITGLAVKMCQSKSFEQHLRANFRQCINQSQHSQRTPQKLWQSK